MREVLHETSTSRVLIAPKDNADDRWWENDPDEIGRDSGTMRLTSHGKNHCRWCSSILTEEPRLRFQSKYGSSAYEEHCCLNDMYTFLRRLQDISCETPCILTPDELAWEEVVNEASVGTRHCIWCGDLYGQQKDVVALGHPKVALHKSCATVFHEALLDAIDAALDEHADEALPLVL